MANLVNLENVGKSYGTTRVLERVSLGVGSSDRIGVVGRNGGGKSTLLRMITGAEPPDQGRVSRLGGLRIATVDQAGSLPAGASVRTAVVGNAAEHEWAGDAGDPRGADRAGPDRVGPRGTRPGRGGGSTLRR